MQGRGWPEEGKTHKDWPPEGPEGKGIERVGEIGDRVKKRVAALERRGLMRMGPRAYPHVFEVLCSTSPWLSRGTIIISVSG